MAAHRAWRVRYLYGYHPNWASVATFELRASVGGADIAGGTAIAKNNLVDYPPANAFDGNNATFAHNDTITSIGWWIGKDWGLGNSVDVAEILWRARNDPTYGPGQSPSSLVIEYSDDNAGLAANPDTAIWIVQRYHTALAQWTAGEARTFLTAPEAPVPGAHRAWRARYIQAHGGIAYPWASVTEIEFRAIPGGPDLTPIAGGSVIARDSHGDNPASRAFDNNTATYAHNNYTILPDAAGWWIGYDAGAGNTINLQEMLWRASVNPGFGADQSPAALEVQYSDDVVTWTTFTRYFDIPGWAEGEARTFTVQVPVAEIPWTVPSITPTDDGYLAFQGYDEPDGAPGSYWSGHGSIVSGALRQIGAGQNGRRVDFADRSEIWRQVSFRQNAGVSVGGITVRHSASNFWYIQSQQGDTQLHLFATGSYTGVSSAAGAYVPGVFQTIQMHARNGLVRWRCVESGVTASHSSVALDAVSGTAGLLSYNTGSVDIDDDLVCTKPEISVTGLPSGYKIRIGAAVAVEAGGVATLDAHLVGLTFPVAQLEVLDASNVVVATGTRPAVGSRPAGVLPGDAYAYTLVPTTQVIITDLAGTAGSTKDYKIEVTSDKKKLRIKTSGGTGNVDVYVRFGSAPDISGGLYDYSSTQPGNDEQIVINKPTVGNWYVTLIAVESYEGVELGASLGGASGRITTIGQIERIGTIN